MTAASVPRRTGLEFSATQSVRATEARGAGAATSTAATASGASTAKAAAPALSAASTGLLDQAVSSGGVGLADAALLDAALDVSPSEMGAVGAASGGNRVGNAGARALAKALAARPTARSRGGVGGTDDMHPCTRAQVHGSVNAPRQHFADQLPARERSHSL